MSVGTPFVFLLIACMFGTLIQETLFNDTGLFNATSKALSSLHTNMLTNMMSTELTKWVVQKSHFYILGGIFMLGNFRKNLARYINLISANNPKGDTEEVREWV